MSNINTPTSPAELLDKISILKIKLDKIENPDKLKNINNELNILNNCWYQSQWSNIDVKPDLDSLIRINQKIWDVEDKIRDKERTKSFDSEFIELARSVYIMNDERSYVKKKINVDLGSSLIEEKSYNPY